MLTATRQPESASAAAEASVEFASATAIRARALLRLAPPPKIETPRWIAENVVVPGDVSDTPGALDLFAYQIGPVAACDEPGVDRVTWIKPSRIGASTAMVGVIASYVKNRPSNILVVQPTTDDARDFMLSTVDPIFAASPNLRGLLTQDEKRRDTIQSRRSPEGWVKCVSAAPRNMRRVFARVVILDEIDGYLPSPEGDVRKLAENRTRTARDRLIFSASTPTDAETSAICRAYAESDQRIYEIRCPHCSEYFEPKFEHVRWDKTDAGEHLPETAHLVCAANGCVIEESSKSEAVAAGRWRATAPHVRGHAGFKCSAIISNIHHARWSQIAREFLEAKKDPELLKVWTNTLMGEPWIDRAGEGIDENSLAARADSSFGFDTMPTEARVLTGAVDVQDDRLVLVTIAHDATTMWALGYEEIWGPPTSDVVWQELDQKIRRTFAHPFGGKLGYDSVGVDSGSGSHTDIVYQWCRPRMGRRCWALKGVAGVRPLIERSSKQGLMIVGVDGAKSRLFGLLERDGLIRFSADLPAQFYAELASERRVVYYKNGQPRKRWERIKGAAAEALDGFVYNMAIRQIVGVDLTQRENELREIVKPQQAPTVIRSKWLARTDRT